MAEDVHLSTVTNGASEEMSLEESEVFTSLLDKRASTEACNDRDLALPEERVEQDHSSQQERQLSKETATEVVLGHSKNSNGSLSFQHEENGSLSFQHEEGARCNDTSGLGTGSSSRTTSQQTGRTTKSCVLSNDLQDVSGAREGEALEDSLEPVHVIRETVKESISEQRAKQSISTSLSVGFSNVCKSQPLLDMVPCEQESTSREEGDGMLVPGFNLVLPRNTLISFCSHQSETFRDRLKPRASDTAGPQAVTTHQDRPPPQQARPPQDALVVKKKPVDDSKTPGRIVRSTDPSLFPVNLVLPVPSKEALQDSIGKGGNGTVTYIYHKRREFAVKKTHLRLGEVDILCKMNHTNVVKLFAVMMGEEDPLRPHRYYCYHFYPRMSGDVQTYLNRLGRGALSNVLMKHKDSPSMLQLVVDNVKHILRCVLKGMHYLHSNDVVHNDIKPSNVLVNLPTQCSCASPVECSCQQLFDVVLTDFDSAIDVRDPEKNKKKWSVVGTAGYRTPERYLQSPEFDDTKPQEWKKGDVWSFGALVLKVFLSHCGPSSQRQIAFLYLWRYANFPWNVESRTANQVLQQKLVQTVYPNWPQLWQLAGDCMQISPLKRPDVAELTNHPFFSS